MEKTIQSWVGKKVRIKPELVVAYEDEDNSVFYSTNISGPINSFISDARNESFEVMMDVYGADLFKHRREGVNVQELELCHQLILKGGQFTGYPFVWKADYFEIIH
jgi:hypothetical protein